MRGLILFTLLALTGAGCNHTPPASNRPQAVNATAEKDTADLRINLRELLANKPLPPDSIVTISYDAFFKSRKKYVGFDLGAILREALAAQPFDTAGAVVIFECTDGYKPTMDLATVLGAKKGYVAIRDLSAPKGKHWPNDLEDKFNPYYLVWEDVPENDHNYAWPYGLVALRVIPGAAALKDAYPVNAPELAQGFNLFKTNCMQCHAVNKKGGSMAPEFNIPKNITEYWREEDIIAFARNPTSYRYNAKMPPVSLSESDLQEIVRYLKHMAGHKIPAM